MDNQINYFRKIIPLVVLILAIGMTGCYKNDYGTDNSGTPIQNEVWLQNISFNPATINVSVGAKVTWTNKDNTIHTVTSGTPGSPNGIFDSGDIGKGGTFTYTFNTKGTFNYYCKPHSSSMRGTVIVQ
ncbi:cupredoxin domain-containing protein [Stygiobacter electus]|uniref:Plastocyanin/azurin family copper-binding protein n=1 Tax=Stygiobacter electus TaxID=3032292 RepID=A0AAE3NVK1_9BACT|nr:plastocyanin/azurin family copper-binding protein [Stygiobacter electus]MDF1611636.1 plastocyanin/azurin family copper-binding protein [Stygiobacter electus]